MSLRPGIQCPHCRRATHPLAPIAITPTAGGLRRSYQCPKCCNPFDTFEQTPKQHVDQRQLGRLLGQIGELAERGRKAVGG